MASKEDTQQYNADFLNNMIRGEGQDKGRWAYYTQPLTLQSLLSSFSGMQNRDMGQAAQSAGAQNAAYGGTNPYAWLQHAQSGVQNKWADIMAQAPQMAFNSEMQSKNSAFDQLARLLQMQQGLSSQQSKTFGGQLGDAPISALGNSGFKFPVG